MPDFVAEFTYAEATKTNGIANMAEAAEKVETTVVEEARTKTLQKGDQSERLITLEIRVINYAFRRKKS